MELTAFPSSPVVEVNFSDVPVLSIGFPEVPVSVLPEGFIPNVPWFTVFAGSGSGAATVREGVAARMVASASGSTQVAPRGVVAAAASGSGKLTAPAYVVGQAFPTSIEAAGLGDTIVKSSAGSSVAATGSGTLTASPGTTIPASGQSSTRTPAAGSVRATAAGTGTGTLVTAARTTLAASGTGTASVTGRTEMTVVNSVSIAPTANSTEIVVPIPQCSIGDLLITTIVQRSSTTDLTIAGWSKPISQVVGASRMFVFWKFRTEADGSTLTVTTDVSTQHIATMTAVSSAAANPIAGTPDSGASTSDSTSAVTPSITVPVAGAFVFRVAWFGGTATDITWPGSVIELAQSTPSGGSGSVLSVAYVLQAAAGTSGTVTASSVSAPRAYATFAIAPKT